MSLQIKRYYVFFNYLGPIEAFLSLGLDGALRNVQQYLFI